MSCDETILGLCFSPVVATANIFGFKDFIAALALLVIIYTISDVRYRFRISVAPARLYTISYVLIMVIGFGSLATDVWIEEKWLAPNSYITAAIWQGTLSALFLGLVITWVHYAFIKPPIFGRNNYKQYARELYRIVLKSSESELPIIAHELAGSAESMVALAAGLNKVKDSNQGRVNACAESYANDMLLLVANRRFCRYLVASSPITAIRFLDAVAESKAYHVPIGLFAQNVSAEAIQNKDSILYHEDDDYRSGLLGHIKPLSHALYGNYELLERIQHHSPLDIHYKLVWAWDAEQFEAYCRVALMTFESYLNGGHWREHSYVLFRALNGIQEEIGRAILDIAKSNDDYIGDAWYRLRAGVGFISDCIDAIANVENLPEARTLRVREKDNSGRINKDFYDRLATAMFNTIHSAAYIGGPPDKAWAIHHNSVWGKFFGLGKNNRAWKIVQFKLRRLLYDEIRDLESLPNYKAARVLGICLNVMGLKVGKRSGYGREEAPLEAAVLAWTQRNYLHLREINEEIADACLIGSITFDAENLRLIKTYAKGLNTEPPKEYLQLL